MPVLKNGQTELVSDSILNELGEVAQRHQVMISITVTPYKDNEEGAD